MIARWPFLRLRTNISNLLALVLIPYWTPAGARRGRHGATLVHAAGGARVGPAPSPFPGRRPDTLGSHPLAGESELQLAEKDAVLGGRDNGRRRDVARPLPRRNRPIPPGTRGGRVLQQFVFRPGPPRRLDRGRGGLVFPVRAGARMIRAAPALRRHARSRRLAAARTAVRRGSGTRRLDAAARQHRHRLDRQHHGCQPDEHGPSGLP